MKTLFFLSTLYCVCSAFRIETKNTGSDGECCSLQGTWVTKTGNFIELNHNADGTLTGTYHDLTKGASKINGQAGKGKPTTFGFVVSLQNGEATKVWTGQYQFCDKEPMLTTRWMMSSVTKACHSGKMPDLIGEETFVRKSTVNHMRSKLGHHIRKLFKKIMRHNF